MWLTRTLLPVFLMCLSAQLAMPAWADNKRKVYINAVSGMEREDLAQYHRAINDGRRYTRKTITIDISGRKGFDAGWLVVDRRKRRLNIEIIINVRRSGGVVSAPISVNLFHLDKWKAIEINQKVKIRK